MWLCRHLAVEASRTRRASNRANPWCVLRKSIAHARQIPYSAHLIDIPLSKTKCRAGFRSFAPERPRPWLRFRGLVEPKVRLDHLPAHDSVRVALQILCHIQRILLDALSRFRRGYVGMSFQVSHALTSGGKNRLITNPLHRTTVESLDAVRVQSHNPWRVCAFALASARASLTRPTS